MARTPDNHNPSDLQRQQTGITAVVVDVRDPQERGRIKCRILGEQDSIRDEDLPWYHCKTASAQLGGVGIWPNPGYLPGSSVVLTNVGQQGFVVDGAIPNAHKDTNKADSHPASTSTSETQIRKGKGPTNRFPLVNGEPWDTAKHVGTKFAKQLLTKEVNNVFERGNPLETILRKAPTLPIYGNRNAIKLPVENPLAKTIGTFKAEGLNAQQFMKSKNVIGPIKEAVDKLESLKKINGAVPSAIAAIGGFGKYIASLQSMIGFIKNFMQNEAGYKELLEQLQGEVAQAAIDEIKKAAEDLTS